MGMDHERLDVLLVPVSGPKGSGEAQAALLLGAALQSSNPKLTVCVVLAGSSVLATQQLVPSLLLPDSPTRCNRQMIELIRNRRPRVVVFDSSCRRSQLAAARAVGARCVFICWRAKSRRRALALTKLFHWHAFWLQSPPLAEGPLGWYERLKLALPGAPTLENIGPIADPPDRVSARALLPPSWAGATYCLLCPGGQYGVQQFRAIADQLVERGLRVVLSCSAEPRSAASPLLLELPRLPNATLLGLVAGSERCLVNGGGLLLQSIALGKKPLALALMRDQAARIDRLAALQLCVAAIGDSAEALSAQCEQLQPTDAAVQVQAASQVGIHDGLTKALAGLHELLRDAAS